MAAYEEEARNYFGQQASERSHSGVVMIASVPLDQYRPEEISVQVDSENVTLHGHHRFEKEDGFEERQFKRVFKIPEGVDPKTVKSRTSQRGGTLLIEGTKSAEKTANDGRFEVKLDFSGFKPEEIDIQLRGKDLTITGKHKSESDDFYLSRDYTRRILLSDDIDLGSLTSRLSKEGLLTVKASRDPALMPPERTVDITMETDE